ncbi:hypothetical protein F511_35311 [Dorcoceras hygrometricum]|uniref:Uncharacterized protein n=1 Tax=Dorcoceras hygrometricum TaxID=472368 RepID=A0A2Z7A6K9_9LAMI|nr:hypothetical protein F511_35311 [Dorcoceras hygrometricum]
MSLFDLQDVCIVIGSLATLDLPMIVDLIGIYVLKGPYCLLVQDDEGTLLQVVDLIRRNLSPPTVKSQSPCDSGWSQAPRRQQESQGDWLFTVDGDRIRLIRSMTGSKVPSSACTTRPDEISTDGNSSKSWPEQIPARQGGGGGTWNRRQP